MSRSRFVKPEVTRLFLADVHRRAHQDLLALTGTGKAAEELLRASEARVKDAVEDGQFIDVKKRLNTGEYQAMLARMSPYQVPGEPVRMGRIEVMTARVLAYLVGWSLADDGKPVAYSPDLSEEQRLAILHNLDPDTFREIRMAIEWHEDEEDKRRDSVKNNPDGETESPASSPSLASVAGGTSGSTS